MVLLIMPLRINSVWLSRFILSMGKIARYALESWNLNIMVLSRNTRCSGIIEYNASWKGIDLFSVVVAVGPLDSDSGQKCLGQKLFIEKWEVTPQCMKAVGAAYRQFSTLQTKAYLEGEKSFCMHVGGGSVASIDSWAHAQELSTFPLSYSSRTKGFID